MGPVWDRIHKETLILVLKGKKISLKPNCAEPTTTHTKDRDSLLPKTNPVAGTKICFSGLEERIEKMTCSKDQDGILNTLLHMAEPSCAVHER